MAISKYSRSIKMPQYTPRSIEEYMMVPKASTEALIGSQEVLDNMLFDKNLLPQDKAKLQEVLDPFNQRIDALSEKVAKGDISPNTLMDLSSLASEYKRLVSPTGTYGRAAGNYDLAMDYLKTAAETYDQDPIIAQAAAQDYINSFATYGDEGFGNGQIFTGKAMPKYVDTQEYLRDLAKDIPATRIAEYLDASGQRLPDNVDIQNYTAYELLGHVDTKSKQRILGYLVNMAQENSDFVRSYNFQMNYTGQEPLYTTEINEAGEQVTKLNLKSPIFRMADVVATGSQMYQENFRNVKPEPKEEKEPKTIYEPGSEALYEGPQVNIDLYTERQTAYTDSQQGYAMAGRNLATLGQGESAGLIRGMLGVTANPYDYKDSESSTPRNNFIMGFQAYQNVFTDPANASLKPNEVQQKAAEAFFIHNPTMNESQKAQFIEYVKDPNNIQFIAQSANSMAILESAEMNSNLISQQNDQLFDAAVNSYASPEEYFDALNIKSDFTDDLASNLAESLREGDGLKDFNIMLLNILKDNTKTLFKEGKEPYKFVVQEQIMKKLVQQTGDADVASNALEMDLVDNMIEKVFKGYEKNFVQNENLNRRFAASMIEYDFPENADPIKTLRDSLIRNILSTRNEVQVVGQSGTLKTYFDNAFGRYIDSNQLAKDLSDLNKWGLNIRAIGSDNYYTLVYKREGGTPISIPINITGISQLESGAYELTQNIFGNSEILNDLGKYSAGKQAFINYYISEDPILRSNYKSLTNLKNDGDQTKFYIGNAPIEAMFKDGIYTVTLPNGATQYYNYIEDFMYDLLRDTEPKTRK